MAHPEGQEIVRCLVIHPTIATQLFGQKNIITRHRIVVLGLDRDHNAAGIFEQIAFWSGHTQDPDGWIYKSYSEWDEELILSEYQVRKATAFLTDRGLIEVTRRRIANGNNPLHYRMTQQGWDFIHSLLSGKIVSSGPDDPVSSGPDGYVSSGPEETKGPGGEETAGPEVQKLQVEYKAAVQTCSLDLQSKGGEGVISDLTREEGKSPAPQVPSDEGIGPRTKALSEVCGESPGGPAFGKTLGWLAQEGIDASRVTLFGHWFDTVHWKGPHRPPSPSQVFALWQQFHRWELDLQGAKTALTAARRGTGNAISDELMGEASRRNRETAEEKEARAERDRVGRAQVAEVARRLKRIPGEARHAQ